MRRTWLVPYASLLFLVCLASPVLWAGDQDPKQTKENTITVELQEPVMPQKFSRPLKFFIASVVDRSGDPQPMLVLRPRGGIYLDRQPTEIVKLALEQTLKNADLLAPDAGSADYVFTVYVFHFGLAAGSGYEYFGKVDLAVMVKDPKTGKSQQITAMGALIQNAAFRKKSIQKNIEANLESALHDGLRNLLRGQKLRDVVDAAPAQPVGGSN